MSFKPYKHVQGEFSQNDGTIDFYSRITSIATKEMLLVDLGAGRAEWFEDDDVPYRRNVRLMRGKVKKVVAVDVDPAVLENKSADEALLMVNLEIPLASQSVDIIIADWVLEHVESPDSLYFEINRVLKPGGFFCARTPHKNSYASIAARIIKNKWHPKLLKFIQPNRNEEDIFPTHFRMNTLHDIHRIFCDYTSKSFIFKADPSYYFGSKIVFVLLTTAQRLMPAFLHGNLSVFLQKPSDKEQS